MVPCRFSVTKGPFIKDVSSFQEVRGQKIVKNGRRIGVKKTADLGEGDVKNMEGIFSTSFMNGPVVY